MCQSCRVSEGGLLDCLPAIWLFVNFVNVAVVRMFVCMGMFPFFNVCVCVHAHVSLRTSGWYLVSGVSAVDI